MIWISFVFVFLNHLLTGPAKATAIGPRTDPNRDRGFPQLLPFRIVEILHFAFLLQGMLRLETLDDIDHTAPSHKFSDDGADSVRRARHEVDFLCELCCLHRYPFVVAISK
jgi:hypothetical protein